MVLTRLLDFGITLLGTLIGVFLAFWLDRKWERRQSKELYARSVNACGYELSGLHPICETIRDQIGPSAAIVLDVDVPALRALLASPALHEHCGHGLTVVLTSLSTFIASVRNLLDSFGQVTLFGATLTEAGIARARDRMIQLLRAIEYAQGLLDQELQRLSFGVHRVPEDAAIVEGFNRALRGEVPES